MIAPKQLASGSAVILLLFGAACAGPEAAEAPLAVPTFQADANWPILPADFEWGQVIGIAADSRGHVWTSSRSVIAEWDPDGNMV